MLTLAAEAHELDPVLLGAWVLTALALALAGVGGRRLPSGVPEGLFVAGLSVLLTLNYNVLSAGLTESAHFSSGLLGLAVLWFVASVWIERGGMPAADDPTLASRAVRRELAVHAAALAALTALPATIIAGPGVDEVTLLVQLALLLAVAGGLYAVGRGAVARYATWAVIVVAAMVITLPGPHLTVDNTRAAGLLLLLAVLDLALVLVSVLSDWQLRRRVWHTATERLVEPPPRRPYTSALAIVFAVIVGLAAVPLATMTLAPLAVFLAALATLTVGHRRRSSAIGEFGLMLVGQCLVLLPVAWLWWWPVRELLGFVLAGAYLLWLSRFWHQQLDRGRPWTTAGRLIPYARQLSYASVAGQLIFAVAYLLSSVGAAPLWQMILILLLMLLHASLLLGDVQRTRQAAPALAAGVVIVSLSLLLISVADQLPGRPPPALVVAACGLLYALRLARQPLPAVVAWAPNAYIGAFLPLAVGYAAIWNSDWSQSPVAVALAIALAVLANVMHWLPRRDPAAAGTVAAAL